MGATTTSGPRSAKIVGASPDTVAEAAAALRAGKLVAFPTETVYGLGADATSPQAVARIYAAKGRPQFNPLIAHVPTRAMAEREGVFSADALRLAEAFWPGPLTLVVPRRSGGSVCDLACAGLVSVGLRIPHHAAAIDLLIAAGRPVAAPSANRSGRISPTEARHVTDDLEAHVALVLDGGPCAIGLESTIVACAGDGLVLLRAGGVPLDQIEAVAGVTGHRGDGGIVAPGMLASHYAPRSAVRLRAEAVGGGEAGLDFGESFGPGHLDLSPSGDLREAAANLYRFLRDLDALGSGTIAVAPIPEHGLGAAINDRLRRAAAPRA